MNINDRRDALLFEVIEKFDVVTNTFLKTYKREDGEIKYKLNFKYFGLWLYLMALLSYIICFIPCVFQNGLIYYILMLIGTSLFIVICIYEERLPRKYIFQKTNVDHKNANLYDSFNLSVEKISSDKLRFLLEYIKYLTSDNTKIKNSINSFSFFVAFLINIIVVNIGDKNDENYLMNLLKVLLISPIVVFIINIIITLISYKKIKLIRIIKYIENVLLFRGAEELS